MLDVQSYLQSGGTITRLTPNQHSETYIAQQEKAKESPSIQIVPLPPSAKACHKCHRYNRGRGDGRCLQCRNYKLLDMEDPRQTITIIPIVSELLEAFPSPTIPDNDLMATVRNMSAQNAAMISVCYYGGLSIREISTVFGISQASAYKKLHRAVSNLRKIIHFKYPHVKSSSEAKASNLLSPYK